MPRDAPVDSMGAEALPQGPDEVDRKTARYQVLVALMLSSQTKDQTVSETIKKLQVGISVSGLAHPARSLWLATHVSRLNATMAVAAIIVRILVCAILKPRPGVSRCRICTIVHLCIRIHQSMGFVRTHRNHSRTGSRWTTSWRHHPQNSTC